MKAVVLAGGQEFGQCPLAKQLPRALWPMIDRPIIQHVLSVLVEAGVGGATISANGRTQDIAQGLGSQPCEGIAIQYSEDALPRGAAGCVKDCQRWLGDETFLVTQGASLLLGVDFAQLVAEHRSSGAAVTVAVDTARPGDAPRPTGLYVCEPAIFPHINGRGYQDMKEQLIPRLVQRGLKVRATVVRGRIVPIRHEEDYLEAMIELLEDVEHREGFTGHLRHREPTVWIDPTATVHPRARMVGPVWIGPGTEVGRGAVVLGPAVIGSHCRMEQGSVVHASILWSKVRVGRQAMVEQAILAGGASVAAGSQVRRAVVTGVEGMMPWRGIFPTAVDFDVVLRRLLPQWCRRVWSGLRPGTDEVVRSP
jgi:mannose-1-phosphate guanylyltransferase/phosphomannomutase